MSIHKQMQEQKQCDGVGYGKNRLDENGDDLLADRCGDAGKCCRFVTADFEVGYCVYVGEQCTVSPRDRFLKGTHYVDSVLEMKWRVRNLQPSYWSAEMETDLWELAAKPTESMPPVDGVNVIDQRKSIERTKLEMKEEL